MSIASLSFKTQIKSPTGIRLCGAFVFSLSSRLLFRGFVSAGLCFKGLSVNNLICGARYRVTLFRNLRRYDIKEIPKNLSYLILSLNPFEMSNPILIFSHQHA